MTLDELKNEINFLSEDTRQHFLNITNIIFDGFLVKWDNKCYNMTCTLDGLDSQVNLFSNDIGLLYYAGEDKKIHKSIYDRIKDEVLV